MQLYGNISYFISYVFLMTYFLLFITLRFSWARTIMICAGTTVCSWFLEFLVLGPYSGSEAIYVAVTLVQIVLTQGTVILLSGTRDSKVIFTGLSGSNYTMAGGIIGSIAYIFTRNIILSLGANILAHSIILAVLVLKIRKIYLSFYEKKNMKNWWELCLIPSLFYCSFCFLAVFPNSLYENKNNVVGIILLLLTMFVSYVVVFRYVENETKRSEIYWENVLFESYIQGLESQYEAVEKAELNLRILRHDMRHYINMIQNLLDQEEYDEIRKITNHVTEVIADNKVQKYCENIQVNSVVSSLMEKSEKLGAKVNLDLRIPEKLPVNALELASVIANLFENALNSVKGQPETEKEIKIFVCYVDNKMIIEVENKCSKEVKMNPVTKLPVNHKGEEHGFGLQSVSAFAGKIGAHFDCYLEQGIFTVRLLANF